MSPEEELTEKPKDIIYFTKEDGLGDILFSPNTACRYGKELFFGSQTSFFSFVPSPNLGQSNQRKSKLIITDLLIDDQPFAQLDSTEKVDISKEMPTYTRRVTIPANIKKLGIEFSLLTYGNAAKNVYAYRLEGYDDDWQYVNGETHSASFQNLPSGTYEFQLKATDSYGHWQEMPYTITIRVLPPWYASRWAFMLYILMLIGAIFATARWYKIHLKTKNRLQMGVILTNITHELLTPLTVISATIYKLKSMAPQYEDDYLVMNSNIDRTTRLLRQILEVRKSQAGQLRLLVSRGNLTQFVVNACESIRPMAEHRNITLHLEQPKGDGNAWFDADKMDKILYNLLSNAIKYNKEGGKIDVKLVIDKATATIIIADNGIGMSKEKLKHLYTRFFDGDYRKQNQPGTGIGLSLTRDLVHLHHGEILCDSTEGKGTTFTLTLPIRRSAFAQSEIDVSNVSRQMDKQAIEVATSEETSAQEQRPRTHQQPSIFIRKNDHKILVVEDNEELLQLMHQMLSQHFHVFTAKNGKQAMNIINKQELDLVVSDVMMPVMDGIELTQQIKHDKRFWQLPVILLIANRKKVQESLIQDQPAETADPKQDAKKELHLSNPEKAFVVQATEMVKKHLDDFDYDRDTFAHDMAMGASTLYNKVKATTGMTIVAFITSIRLKEARRIIEENPNILISDVSLRVGFNTPKYFSKCFKKEFGIFPKEFAERIRKEANP